jgi:hypothetical protein
MVLVYVSLSYSCNMSKSVPESKHGTTYSTYFFPPQWVSNLPGNREFIENSTLRTGGVVAYDSRCFWLFPGRGFNSVSLESTAGTAVSCNSSVNSSNSGSG